MLITERLRLKDIMSKTEEELADFFLREGENLKKYSSRSLAEATYTSPATIVRMCKRLGFAGFDDFKEQFLAEIRYLDQQPGAVDVNFPFAKGDSLMKAANRMAQLYEEVTRDTLSLLQNDVLQKAVRILRASENVCIYSMGTAINQAECFREKMLKIGKRVTISSNLNYQLYEAGCLSVKDAAVIISYSGETRKMLQIAAECKKRHVPVIAITSFGENSLTRYATCKLTQSTRESMFQNLGDFSSHLSVSLLLDILYSAYFLQDYERHYQNKQDKTRMLEKFRKSSNSVIMGEETEEKKEL
ncbi:MAG: MurR/RpiR family transcriptional regulator [Lachnospiraceae bacterium]|nr:MurR/RpiR family transcriptional regulator [Lachnospiraceae bacterium]